MAYGNVTFLRGVLGIYAQLTSARFGVRHTTNRARYVTWCGYPPIDLRLCIVNSSIGILTFADWLKLSVRSALNRQLTREWLAFWNSNLMLGDIARSSPQVLRKIFRPYSTNTLHCRDRLSILTGHYAFMLEQGMVPLLLRAMEKDVELCEFSGKSGSLYQIHLAAVRTLDREGELVLHLKADGVSLYSIAFTVVANDNESAIAVGCLQGLNANDGLEKIRNATRDLFGMRPKNLLVRLVREIGYRYGCRELRLVSNENRVITRQIRRGKVFANYDTMWQELGAERSIGGDFVLPCAATEAPDMAEIPSKKRSELRKRHVLMDQVLEATWIGLTKRY